MPKGWNGPTVGPTAVDYVRAVITDRGAVTINALRPCRIRQGRSRLLL
jgi:hypothetical protein